MNIDLRNISSEFEDQVNAVKKRFDINTNSKAVEHCVVNYLSKLEEIDQLKKKLDSKNQELSEIKNNVYHFKTAFEKLLT